MNWKLLISWRYFMAKRKQRFISFISLISILGIAVGVMALIVVISVMNGFDQELRERIVGLNPHISIGKENGIENPEELYAILDQISEIKGVAPFINGQALLQADKTAIGVLLRGIEPARERSVSKIESYLVAGSFDLGDEDIVIGEELASKFHLDVGDRVSLISSGMHKPLDVKIAGIFNSGMYEYDLNLVLTNIQAAQKLFGLKEGVGGIGLKLANLYQAPKLRQSLQQRLGYLFWVSDWMQMNRNLFSALQLEKTAMFVIVALIVAVACLNIIGHLIMMVMEKTKDIGILKAIGATNQAIRRIFTLEGLIIGFSGTAMGAAGGFLLCYLLRTYKFISLPQDIYYIENLPVQMRWIDSTVIIVAALVITLVASIYPANQAARLNPTDTLRYE